MRRIILILFLIGLYSSAFAQSPKRYHVFKRIKVNWHAAFMDCLSRDMQLATVYSLADQRELDAALSAADNTAEWFYISGTDQAEEGNFLWMSTGKPVTYSRFASGEPNNKWNREHCLIVYNEGGRAIWNDSWCLHKLFYICEEKPETNENYNLTLVTC